jgi:hypothetical protein
MQLRAIIATPQYAGYEIVIMKLSTTKRDFPTCRRPSEPRIFCLSWDSASNRVTQLNSDTYAQKACPTVVFIPNLSDTFGNIPNKSESALSKFWILPMTTSPFRSRYAEIDIACTFALST